MKASIFSVSHGARIVDLTHSIPPQDVAEGARVLGELAPRFPAGTIHVAVVDPGVGTEREIVCVQIGTHFFVCPDNGLLSRLARERKPTRINAVTSEEYFLPPVSATFHGRDIMAPVAAHLSLGVAPELLGPPREGLVHLEQSRAERMGNRITGRVVAVDSFGNLVTDITAADLADAPTDETVTVHCDGHETLGIYRTYGDQPPLTFIALVGSGDALELAIVEESAAAMLGVGVGAEVEVRW